MLIKIAAESVFLFFRLVLCSAEVIQTSAGATGPGPASASDNARDVLTLEHPNSSTAEQLFLKGSLYLSANASTHLGSSPARFAKFYQLLKSSKGFMEKADFILIVNELFSSRTVRGVNASHSLKLQ